MDVAFLYTNDGSQIIVAAKCDHPGVLILSEMAGAAVELTDAIQINPNDTEQIEHAICQQFVSDAPFSASALNYTIESLDDGAGKDQRHSPEVEKANFTKRGKRHLFLCTD